MSSTEASSHVETTFPKKSIRSRISKYLKSWIIPFIIALVFISFAILAATLYSGKGAKDKVVPCTVTCPPCESENTYTPEQIGQIFSNGDGKLICVGIFVTDNLLIAPGYCVLNEELQKPILKRYGEDPKQFFKLNLIHQEEKRSSMSELVLVEANEMANDYTHVPVPILEYETSDVHRTADAFGWVKDSDHPIRVQIVLFSSKVCFTYFRVRVTHISELYCSLDVLPEGFKGVVLSKHGIIGLWMGPSVRKRDININIVRGISHYNNLFV